MIRSGIIGVDSTPALHSRKPVFVDKPLVASLAPIHLSALLAGVAGGL